MQSDRGVEGADRHLLLRIAGAPEDSAPRGGQLRDESPAKNEARGAGHGAVQESGGRRRPGWEREIRSGEERRRGWGRAGARGGAGRD